MLPYVLGKSKVYQDFKTTVPKEVRERLNIKNGDELVYYIQNGLVVLDKNSESKKKRFFNPG